MLDPLVLFLCVGAAWFVLRIMARRWSTQKLATGELSGTTWALINAGSWALLPLLAIPFMADPDGRALLVLLAIAMFFFQIAVFVIALRFVQRG